MNDRAPFYAGEWVMIDPALKVGKHPDTTLLVVPSMQPYAGKIVQIADVLRVQGRWRYHIVDDLPWYAWDESWLLPLDTEPELEIDIGAIEDLL